MSIKKCTRCEQEKDTSEFYLIKRPPPRAPSLYRHCKSCCSIVSRENRDYSRNWELKKQYNITLEDYKNQVKDRCSKCDICKKTEKSLHVDHDHETGLVRGFLCGSCNRGIGLLQDSVQICLEAAKYLERTK